MCRPMEANDSSSDVVFQERKSGSSFTPDYPACFQNSSNELPKTTFHEAVVCLKVLVKY